MWYLMRLVQMNKRKYLLESNGYKKRARKNKILAIL